MISLSNLITCLLDNVWILLGEVTCKPLLRAKGLISLTPKSYGEISRTGQFIVKCYWVRHLSLSSHMGTSW